MKILLDGRNFILSSNKFCGAYLCGEYTLYLSIFLSVLSMYKFIHPLQTESKTRQAHKTLVPEHSCTNCKPAGSFILCSTRSLGWFIVWNLNPLVPGMQNLKIRKFNICCLLFVCFVKRLVCLDAHCSERQGVMG